MGKTRLAIELEFDDELTVVDFYEHGHATDLIDNVVEYLEDRMDGRVKVIVGYRGDPYLTLNPLTKEWWRPGPPRPSEIAMAKVDAKNNPDTTHWDRTRERIAKQQAFKAEEARKDAELAEVYEQNREGES